MRRLIWAFAIRICLEDTCFRMARPSISNAYRCISNYHSYNKQPFCIFRLKAALADKCQKHSYNLILEALSKGFQRQMWLLYQQGNYNLCSVNNFRRKRNEVISCVWQAEVQKHHDFFSFCLIHTVQLLWIHFYCASLLWHLLGFIKDWIH